jgi:hypothetical protein
MRIRFFDQSDLDYDTGTDNIDRASQHCCRPQRRSTPCTPYQSDTNILPFTAEPDTNFEENSNTVNYAAPAPLKSFDAAPTLPVLCTKPNFFYITNKLRLKERRLRGIFASDFF